MNRDEYQELRDSGGLVDDAGQQEEEVVDVEEPEHEEVQDEVETDVEVEESDEDDLPPLSEKEQTAFQKRMERESKKMQEKLEAELKQQYEQQYGRHKQVIEMLGGDPDAIEKRIRDQQVMAEAHRMAEQNGWDEEQTHYYAEQQKQQRELKELRVQMQINLLKDNPDYAGISAMEKDIMAKIDKTGGALSAEEAYWALGGPKKAEQIRLEAQVRAQVKRQKQPRTILTDSPTAAAGDKPLSSEVARDAERMGIDAKEARRLMNSEPASNLESWRKQRKAK